LPILKSAKCHMEALVIGSDTDMYVLIVN